MSTISSGISFQALSDLLTATLPRVNRRWQDTQGRTSYPFINAFNIGSGSPIASEVVYDYVRLAVDPNTVRMGYYGQASSRGQTYAARMQTLPARLQNRGLFFDASEKVFNRSEAEIFDHIEMKHSGVMESLTTEIDDQIGLEPASQADQDHEAGRTLGPLVWLPVPAVGATADYIGGFNGTTLTRLDGSTTTTIAGQDRSLAKNARLASFQISYTGEIDDVFRLGCIRAINKTKFEPIDGLKGEKPGGTRPNVLFMPSRQYDDAVMYVNRGPDDNQGKIIRYESVMPVMGMKPMRAPSWDSFAHAPIVGVRMSKWKIEKGRWFFRHKPVVDQNNSNVALVQIDCEWRLRCTNPREGGFTMSVPR